MEFELLKDEYWWGGMVHRGAEMPFDAESEAVIDLAEPENPNQASPFFLSSRGRILLGEKPFCVRFCKGTVRVTGAAELIRAGDSLKEAYLEGMRRGFPFEEKIPDPLFFSMPQYNTWIELMQDQNEQGILAYAEGILEHGLPAGILMIDDGWAADYGEFAFHPGKFADPRGMIRRLHEMGFRVMLWVCPYVSPDSAAFRALEKMGCLLCGPDGQPAVRRWWNGWSAGLDLTNPDAEKWFQERLCGLMREYGVDGFKFDGGDPSFYRTEDRAYRPALPQEHARQYALFAGKFRLNELRAGWNLGGRALVMRLNDKCHSWDQDGLNMLIPNSLAQGLLGYAYHCPDMIGGGEFQSFLDHSDALDRNLIVRYAQASALCPMMQFSAAPWRVLDTARMEMVRRAAELHRQMGERILALAEHAAKTGEPIMRHMAYEFPNEGFERVSDQFMLGSDILAAPVLKRGAVSREVSLPSGRWKSADGQILDGGRTVLVDAPLDSLPYFERME